MLFWLLREAFVTTQEKCYNIKIILKFKLFNFGKIVKKGLNFNCKFYKMMYCN